MADQMFHISHNGEEMGPMSLDEIVSKVKSGDLNVMDYIYDEEAGDWIPFVQSENLMQLLSEVKPKTPPKKESAKASEPVSAESSDAESQWYVLKGESKFGPFSYGEVVKMLQEKLVFEFDFVWKPGMESWTRIAEVKAFEPDQIKSLKSESKEKVSDLFFRRRHKRAVYNGTLIVHNNNKVWKGRAFEISAGGAGVIIENAMAVPGDTLYLHFKPCDGVPPFNAVCEVVSKKYVEGIKGENESVCYGIKFTEITEDDKRAVSDYASRAKSA